MLSDFGLVLYCTFMQKGHSIKSHKSHWQSLFLLKINFEVLTVVLYISACIHICVNSLIYVHFFRALLCLWISWSFAGTISVHIFAYGWIHCWHSIIIMSCQKLFRQEGYDWFSSFASFRYRLLVRRRNLTACLAAQLICSRVHWETAQSFLVVQTKFWFEVTAKWI